MEQQYKKTHVFEQCTPEQLTRQTLVRGQGQLAASGALCVLTGKFTGRSPEDKYIVLDTVSEDTVDWNRLNQPFAENKFITLWNKVMDYLDKRPEVWARNMYACADERYKLPVRVVTESPWANLFAANLFIEPTEQELTHFMPAWQILQAPGFLANPLVDGTKNENFTIISFKHKVILIGGSAYTGEIKKSVFSVLNFLLPQEDVLSMHCSANMGKNGDVALFFGLSGTGKTTLSTEPSRTLIGDDEHGWSDEGIFNIEGGCYAKIINLSQQHEPDIYNAIKDGALIENTLPDEKGAIDFGDSSRTENTRASYPLEHIPGTSNPSAGKHPKHIFFLCCDAYGVLPPVSRLNEDQVRFYFLNGYTAKVAGTEVGVTEPKATFSACFGAPFLPLHPEAYANLLINKIKKHSVNVWLINTGWTGGSFGTGKRFQIKDTRAIIDAVLNNKLTGKYRKDRFFDVDVPLNCPGVDDTLLEPQKAWTDAGNYPNAAGYLADLFRQNFEKFNKETLHPQIPMSRIAV